MLVASLILGMAPPEIEDRAALATVAIGQPGAASHQTIAISLARPLGAPLTRDAWQSLTWHAVRTSSHGQEEITSDGCPALKTAALAFRELPPITPTPVATIVRDEPLPLNVIALGGWGVTVSYKTFSGADVSVSGSDAYAAWGSGLVNGLLDCWEHPLP